jgi:hypothetical protein
MRTHCYYLAYRKKVSKLSVNWRKPTGGLMLKPERIVDGYPVGDFQLAWEVLKRRYHCGPHEELIVAEVFEKQEMRMARKLFRQWEAEAKEFLELMAESA